MKDATSAAGRYLLSAIVRFESTLMRERDLTVEGNELGIEYGIKLE